MWDIILDAIFQCIQFFAHVVGDWGLGIIIITLIFRLLITPLMYKQAKSSFQMQKIQPLIKEIQTKYADDQVRQSNEMQRLYAEAKFNPLASCIPMLIQMPIFIALFQVLRGMADTTSRFYQSGSDFCFYNLVPNLVISPSDSLGMVADQGVLYAVPYFLLLIIFAVCTFIPSILQMKDVSDEKQRNQTLMMTFIMGIMMLFIGWSSPAGVLLFWGASSILAIIQQQGSLSIIRRKYKEEQANKPYVPEPVKIEVTRKKQKKRQTKKR